MITQVMETSNACYLRADNTRFSLDGMTKFQNTFAGRLALAREARGLSQDQLAEKAGLSQVTINHIETGRNATSKKLVNLAQALQVPAGWLANGDDHMYVIGRLLEDGLGDPSYREESNAELIGMMSGWDGRTPLEADEVAIPLYKEVEMAAGFGATEVIEVPGRLLRFAKSTLREAGVQEQNAACATIKGRSMERLIMDGATIGIDLGTTHIDDGEIYAFDQDGMLRVKYLYRLPGGGVRIRSENDEEFPDETLTAEQFANIRMLGWVFWWSTVRRRRGLSLAK